MMTGSESLPYDVRLSYYANRNYSANCTVKMGQPLNGAYFSSGTQSLENLLYSVKKLSPDRRIINHPNQSALFSMYVRPIQIALNSIGQNGMFLVYVGDNTYGFQLPTFAKSSKIDASPLRPFFLPLNFDRHFRPLLNVSKHDRPFSDKTPVVAWRGATTSSFEGTSRYHVFEKFDTFSQLGFDIGFSKVVQSKSIWTRIRVSEEDLQRRVKPQLNHVKMLQYKYLLSLEGNDVASGLKWMLGSNSLVLMPPPTCTSWACEVFLEPYRHYVPVREDLSDLQEKFEWCEANPRLVEEIVANATEFMQPFLDQEQERRLVRDVVQTYVDSVEFDVPDEFRHLFFP